MVVIVAAVAKAVILECSVAPMFVLVSVFVPVSVFVFCLVCVC